MSQPINMWESSSRLPDSPSLFFTPGLDSFNALANWDPLVPLAPISPRSPKKLTSIESPPPSLQQQAPWKPPPVNNYLANRADSPTTRALDIEAELTKQNLFKTELCRNWQETGLCRYGPKCQFAHGQHELRGVQRHPKYKTEICRTFHSTGTCGYGQRCRFVHQVNEMRNSVDDSPSGLPGNGSSTCPEFSFLEQLAQLKMSELSISPTDDESCFVAPPSMMPDSSFPNLYPTSLMMNSVDWFEDPDMLFFARPTAPASAAGFNNPGL